MKLFVYGSLKRGYANNECLGCSEFIGRVKTELGYTLYHNGYFPMMVREQDKQVVGELYEVAEDILSFVDSVEGHPIMYERQTVRLDTGEEVNAYLWGQSQKHLKYLGEEW